MSCETGGIQKEPNDSFFFTEEFKGFCKGNALKCLIRAGKKDDELQDLKKAGVYIGWCIDAQSTSKSK